MAFFHANVLTHVNFIVGEGAKPQSARHPEFVNFREEIKLMGWNGLGMVINDVNY